ncbi:MULTISPECIES: GIY-YIG nuclease family protein [unclassified Clostridium]|jgi:putative endonuclease|uniref:GIY-YIG nuclease family protein n=1 Tax=unclassified Clostridium TaxID=2614128 RepID=UPI001106256B|nr:MULTISPECIES: GIY-YIG nuclease family protein [unclassified Clostridium]
MPYFVYMLTNPSRTVLYIGVTGDLTRRLAQHRSGETGGFTARYHTHRLVYFEQTTDVRAAIAREKQLKGWSRAKKDALVESVNPLWQDLSASWK